MAKKQGRAARKQLRERAKKAEIHGLPSPEAAPLPARLRPKLIDESGEVKLAAYSAGSRREVSRRAADAQAARGGLPTIAKVGIGAAAVLLLVFAASQLRKANHGLPPESPGEIGAETVVASQEIASAVEALPAQEPAAAAVNLDDLPEADEEIDSALGEEAVQEDVTNEDGSGPQGLQKETEPSTAKPVSSNSKVNALTPKPVSVAPASPAAKPTSSAPQSVPALPMVPSSEAAHDANRPEAAPAVPPVSKLASPEPKPALPKVETSETPKAPAP